MKKLLTIAVFYFLLMPVTQVFASDALTKLTITQGAELGFTPSSLVKVYYACYDTNSGNSPQWYVATAKHNGGDKAYGITTRSNILVTPPHNDCIGKDSIACAAIVGATAMTASENGRDKAINLTNWNIL